ncbi:hypothetical protein F4604DRAFT_2044449 [Suillus subluteus]|nr:hypothetical protein F4604DRAFT_2044449 [Suillus subluteus]
MDIDPSDSGDKGEVDDITEVPFALICSLFQLTLVDGIPQTTSYPLSSSRNSLATGDKGGSAVVFECNESSHELEFNDLKFLEIEEKINKIKRCRRQNTAHFLLSTNGPTPLSLPALLTNPTHRQDNQAWGNVEKSIRIVSESNHLDDHHVLPNPSLVSNLKLPRMQQQDNNIAAVPDDLHINLWNLSISDQSFNMRDSTQCDRGAKCAGFEEEGKTSRSFFFEILSSVSDVKLSDDGRSCFAWLFFGLSIFLAALQSRSIIRFYPCPHFFSKRRQVGSAQAPGTLHYVRTHSFNTNQIPGLVPDPWVPLLSLSLSLSLHLTRMHLAYYPATMYILHVVEFAVHVSMLGSGFSNQDNLFTATSFPKGTGYH